MDRSSSADPASLYEVSRHVALLLLLASGRRVHDLTLLSTNPTQFQELGSSFVLWPTIGFKTDSSSHQQSGWQLSPNPNPVFTLVSWIRDLVTLSKCRRGSLPFPHLFLTTRGAVGPASRSVIGGWIRTALQAAGIAAPPVSLRAAVAHGRFHVQSSIDFIMQRGNWQRSALVFRHYVKSVSHFRSPTTAASSVIHQDFASRP